MIPKIRAVETMPGYLLNVLFDDGKVVVYDVKEDIHAIASFRDLVTIYGLFHQVQLDPSRTCLSWNDRIDLPSDTIYEYGKPLKDWDPDVTKATPPETQQLAAAEESGFADEERTSTGTILQRQQNRA